MPQLTVPSVPVRSDPGLAAAGTDSSVSKVPLALALVGTMPGRNSTEGSAMLGTDARNAQTYMAGAMLESGARLAEIYKDRVILQRNGEQATLYLSGSSKASMGSSLLTVGGREVKIGATPRFTPDPVSEYIRAIPYYRNDAIAGFRVFPGAISGPFTQWGLKAGDVITSINGSPLVDANQTAELLSELANAASLSARVLRGSEITTVALNGVDLVKLAEARKAPPLALQSPPTQP
jgi:general secretion pathway protein C